VLYHQTIMKNIKMYHEASSDDVRHDILLKVWDSTNDRGGRFLLQVEDGQLWEKLDIQPAIYKIGQAFDFLCMQLYAPKHLPPTLIMLNHQTMKICSMVGMIYSMEKNVSI
jgi:hypothetical protein